MRVRELVKLGRIRVVITGATVVASLTGGAGTAYGAITAPLHAPTPPPAATAPAYTGTRLGTHPSLPSAEAAPYALREGGSRARQQGQIRVLSERTMTVLSPDGMYQRWQLNPDTQVVVRGGTSTHGVLVPGAPVLVVGAVGSDGTHIASKVGIPLP